jgi:hypothetical protein
MQTALPAPVKISWSRRLMRTTAAVVLLFVFGFAQTGRAQTTTNPLGASPFKEYFVTGDYVVAGWVKGAPDFSGFAPGTISIPDTLQPTQNGVPTTVPVGADIVAAYLYWETVEGNQSTFAGQNGFFNGYAISGDKIGNLNAPTSWAPGGCSGSNQGSKTIRAYRADVRPYLPLDINPASPTFGALLTGGNINIPVRLADSGSGGNGVPIGLGATLVIIYRVLSPPAPLNSIVIYDGAFAPSNSTPNISQQIVGFYQAAASPVAKITHIVGDGQPAKSEIVSLNTTNLPSLYPTPLNPTLPPFPGIYNGSFDNPTWPVSAAVLANEPLSSETTFVMPTPTNGNCVSWGAIVFSTTVPDPNRDALLPVWKAPLLGPPGYTDVISNQFVALPGASTSAKDIFVELDYLTLRDANGIVLHSHLPKQKALDMVGDAYWKQNIHAHFDVGTNYNASLPLVPGCKLTPALSGQGIGCPDPYIIQGGTGGNEIAESAVVCTDSGVPPLCQFPGQAPGQPGPPAVGWKGDFLFVRDNANDPISNLPLGNFQPGRQLSYQYVLFGHALGDPESFWSTAATALSDPTNLQLISIVNTGTTASVTIQTPPPPAAQGGFIKPGDCPNTAIPACSDANNSRVTVGGALGQPALNGTYFFNSPSSSPGPNGSTTTTFTITTANLPSGTTTYNFSNEPQLNVEYLGPTSTSGHSDFGGGGDSAVTFGLWGADDADGCQADPSVTLAAGQVYCNNQVGTVLQQAGTLMHEVGHALTLTHGGAYYNVPNYPSVATYELNCKSNFLSVMSYLFQVRGFPDGGIIFPPSTVPNPFIDYSGQMLPNLSEAALDESFGIGAAAAHYTRWYAPPNLLQTQIGQSATHHCDGTPLLRDASGNIIEPPAVRVDGSISTEPSGFSGPIDWNIDLTVPDLDLAAWQDVNFNGSTLASPDPPFQGFNDWLNVDLRQIGARAGEFGFSGGGLKGHGLKGHGSTDSGGGLKGHGLKGHGAEQDEKTACSTADPPTSLSGVQSKSTVVLSWNAPEACQVQEYDIWRAEGSFSTPPSVLTNHSLFKNVGKVKGTPPLTTFTDTKLKNNTTYTYFVTDTNGQGATSPASATFIISVSF